MFMREQFNRRECLRRGAAGLAAGAMLNADVFSLSAAEESPKPVRIGVVGVGPRGSYLARCLATYYPGVSVRAVCDLDRRRADAAVAIIKQITGTAPVGYCKGEHEYRNMFQRDDLDGIVVATGVQVLAPIAVDAMKAGKHVSAEVTGANTLDDCWAIVEEKERSGKHYMLLEECCYDDVNLMILGMIKRGLFGEPYYAECSYVHDCKVDTAGNPRFVTGDQTLSWRGRLLAEGHGSAYGPHGIASAAKWLGINDGDRFESCSAVMSDPREVHAQMVERFGRDSKAAKIKFQTGDFLATLIRTVKGKMIRLDYSISSTRPYSRYYLLQGMTGCFDSRSGIYVRGDRPREYHAQWTPTSEFFKKYRHPWWTKSAETAKKTGGHGGMDYFCLRDFVDMVRGDHEPWIDCYDTAAYNALNQCSQLSIDRKGAAVEIPDFTKGKWKDADWRKGRPGPATAISG
jgi:predicted dehydrogenase